MAPVNLTAEQYNLLTGFAEMALRELERDHHAALTQRRHEHMLRTANCFKSGVLLCDVAEPSWPILFANAAWTGLTGTPDEKKYYHMEEHQIKHSTCQWCSASGSGCCLTSNLGQDLHELAP